MLDRDTGRPRGFGFVTFADRRAMEDAIDEMHGQELDGRSISVNRAQPKMSDDPGYAGGGYSSGGRGGGYRRGDRDRPPPSSVGSSDCFKCGRPGHWARECPSDGGGFSSRSRFGGGGRGDRYVDDRYDGGRYGDRDHVASSRDRRVSSGRDHYGSDRYPSGGDRHYGGGSSGGGGDRYGGTGDRYPQNGYGKERSYDMDGRRGGGGGDDRYVSGGGPMRNEGGGGYRERPTPYDRPGRGGRPSSYDR